MESEGTRVRQNYLAILVAAIACFLIEAAWYSYFLQAWLKGVDRTMQWLSQSGLNPAVQYAVAILSQMVMATAISCVTQLTGRQTIFRGIKVGVLLWLGLIVPLLAVNDIFEVRPWSLFGINAGFWFFGTIAMGAIVGGWRKR